MSNPSAIANLQVDPAKVLDASYRFDFSDRRYLDNQILGVQRHLVDSLIAGAIGTWFTVDPGGSAVAVGDVVVVSPTSSATKRVVRGESSEMAAAGVALGIAMTSASPGANVRVVSEGVVPKDVTGLSASDAGPVRVSSAGRAEKIVSFGGGDYPLGYVDAAGNLSLERTRSVGSGGGGGENLAQTLGFGKATGGNNIDFTGGDNISLLGDGSNFQIAYSGAATGAPEPSASSGRRRLPARTAVRRSSALARRTTSDTATSSSNVATRATARRVSRCKASHRSTTRASAGPTSRTRTTRSRTSSRWPARRQLRERSATSSRSMARTGPSLVTGLRNRFLPRTRDCKSTLTLPRTTSTPTGPSGGQRTCSSTVARSRSRKPRSATSPMSPRR